MVSRVFIILIVIVSLSFLTAQAQEKQPRSDRIVGYWKSSQGTPVNIAYSGRAATFLITVYPGTEILITYTAHWISDSTFYYEAKDETSGGRIEGRVEAGGKAIRVASKDKSWSATWTRRK